MEITFSIDLEDPTGRYEPYGRYVAMTRQILDFCDRLNRKATFFTVGRVAQAAPLLLRDIVSRGHEIAYHSHNHVPLTKDQPWHFQHETRIDKDALQQIIGNKVIGFRAPCFSLTPETQWALDVLAELGFRYSSSIMPTNISRFGYPDAPRASFTWPNGIIEFPLPVAEVGKYRLPYLGGIYLYTMPMFAFRKLLAKAAKDEVLWTYAHPYDFDKAEKFSPMPGTPIWISLVLWLARKKASKKIEEVLKLGLAPPFAERLP